MRRQNLYDMGTGRLLQSGMCGVAYKSATSAFRSLAREAIKGDENLRRKIKEVADVVNSIPTRYKLTGKDTHSDVEFESETLQDYLFRAAEYLIRLDSDSEGTPITKRVEDWFAEKEKGVQKCEYPK